MANLKCVVVWLVLLIVEFNLRLVSNTPIPLTTPKSTHNASLVCPVFPVAFECPPEPDDECNNDQECAELHPGLGMKCCKTGCDMICATPVQGNTPTTPPPTSPVNGTCPVFPEAPECPQEPDDECNNDQKCAELDPGLGMKCCIDGCDMRCVPPVQGNTPTAPPPTSPVNGTCPVFPEAVECPPELDNDCYSDQECAELYPGRELKCCMVGCENRCITPVREKLTTTQPVTIPVNGTCQQFPTSDECPPEPDDECNNDQKCAELHPGLGMKCCKTGCDMRCVAPVNEKAQTNPSPTVPDLVVCPHFPPAECIEKELWDNECLTDMNCTEMHPGHAFKCCDVGCQYRCIPPAKIKFPTFLPLASLQEMGLCPVFPVPAQCPNPVSDECIDDQQCAEFYPGLGFKCCQDGCGRLCLPPEQGKKPTTRPPTFSFELTCPRVPPAECPPEEDIVHECITDHKCAELYPGRELKCCMEGCENRCITPVREKLTTTQPVTIPVNGTCPQFPTSDECPPEPDDECNNDQKCDELHPGLGMKCCIDGCDMICATPV